MLSKSKFYRIFVEILICQVVLIAIMGIHKPSYFVDEIWTYNLANAYFFPAFENVEGYYYTWVKPEFWKTLVVVAPEHTFSYSSVWHNQATDVLPPFFYAVVHTVSSFFPGVFNNWFVMGPNLCFFAGSQVCILLIARKIFKQTWLALVPVIMYGFTLGGINTVLYFRMYMMVTFFGLVAFYLHLRLLDRLQEATGDIFTAKSLILLAVVHILGFLTHYYYLIYATFLAVATMWYLNRKQLYTVYLKYLGCNLAALLTSFAIFPAAFNHITGIGSKNGYRGAQSLGNAFDSPILKKLGEYTSFIIKDLGGDLLLLLLLIVLAMVINQARKQVLSFSLIKGEKGLVINARFHKPDSIYSLNLSYEDYYVALAIFVSLSYYIIITKISVMNDDRYIFMILPLFIIWGFYLLNRIVFSISSKQYLAAIMCVTMVWLGAIGSVRAANLKFADMELPATLKTVEDKYSEVPLIAVSSIPHWHPIIEHMSLMEKVPKAFLTTENELEKIKTALEDISFTGEKLLLFVTWECKKPLKDIQEELKTETGFKHVKQLYEGGKFKRGHLYLLSK